MPTPASHSHGPQPQSWSRSHSVRRLLYYKASWSWSGTSPSALPCGSRLVCYMYGKGGAAEIDISSSGVRFGSLVWAREGIAFHAPSHSPDVFEHAALEDRPCRKHESGRSVGRTMHSLCFCPLNSERTASGSIRGHRSSCPHLTFMDSPPSWRKICCPASRPFPGE